MIHLSRILGERRMAQVELARLTGIRPNTINDMYHGTTERIGLDQLDKICEVLNCNLSELLEYIPNIEKRTGKKLILETHGNRKK